MRKWLPLVLILMAFGASAAAWPRIPERVPVHWNFAGDVDRWGSRVEGALLVPFIALGMLVLFRVLPRIDPRRENYAKFADTYDLVVLLIVGEMVLLHLLLLGFYLGLPISISRTFPAAIGLLLIGLGNVIPRFRSTWWVGIRTPWTLSDDRVWARTHRLAGYGMMAGGVMLVLSALIPSVLPMWLAIALAVTATLLPGLYSYVIWRRLRGS